MPIYEYSCRACGHGLEALQKMSDPPLTDCPECGRPDLQKQVSAAGFVLKGGGWYVTDFRDKGGKKGANGSGDDSSGASSAGDTGSGDSGSGAKKEGPGGADAAAPAGGTGAGPAGKD